MINEGECPICLCTTVDLYREDKDRMLTSISLGPSRGEISSGRILRCRRCRFGFSQVRPDEKQLGEMYEHMEIGLYESESIGRSISALRQLKVIERYATPPRRLLDIGCASGLFLRQAIDAGWDGEGIEPCEPLVRRARHVLGSEARIHFATLQAAPVTEASFDVVTLWDVLEHVPNPIGFLALAGSLLKPGGVLFANVPNLDSIQARLLRSKWPLILPEHLNYFNRNNLRMCGERSGLRWIDFSRRSATFSLDYLFYRLRQHGVPGSSLAYRLVNTVGFGNLTISVPLGEICGVWQR
jgi:SAM-dependent methyltransferase